MQWIYVVRPTRPALLTEGLNAEEMAAIERHGKYLDDLAAEGKIHLYGRTQNADPSTFGIVVYDAADEEEARAIMNADPAVLAGVMSPELYPYKIAYIRKER